jgi:hypothetical protein
MLHAVFLWILPGPRGFLLLVVVQPSFAVSGSGGGVVANSPSHTITRHCTPSCQHTPWHHQNAIAPLHAVALLHAVAHHCAMAHHQAVTHIFAICRHTPLHSNALHCAVACCPAVEYYCMPSHHCTSLHHRMTSCHSTSLRCHTPTSCCTNARQHAIVPLHANAPMRRYTPSSRRHTPSTHTPPHSILWNNVPHRP